MDVMETIRERAKKKCPTLVYAEGENPVVVEAALMCRDQGVCKPVLLGNPEVVHGLGLDTKDVTIIDVATQAEKIAEYAKLYEELEDFPAEAVEPMLQTPLNFATMMLRAGDADGMVAGYEYTTADVISASQMFIGLAEGTDTASSYVIMDVPGWQGGEDGLIAFGDCSMVPHPNAKELGDIAVNTANSVHKLLGWDPRVALISFSTTGSAEHEDIDKVRAALAYAREQAPDLVIDGELQVDAAIKPTTSLKKVKGDNPLKGEANVLIFPDLDAGNAACKLVQIFAKANMYGAIMCGFAKPLTDLSRNMGAEDIAGVSAIVAAQV